MFLHLLLLANGPPPFSATEPLVGATKSGCPYPSHPPEGVRPRPHHPLAKTAKSHINLTFGFFYAP